jgi:hypothetical protein
MPPPDEPHETDDRFPTGEWTGFYMQPDSRQRYKMDLFLEFLDGKISGKGDDPVGEFTISGTYDATTGECSWTKQYVGQHGVEYAGEARQRGIVGQWRVPELPEFWSGPFFVWPRALGDLESAFEKAFLECELSGPAFASLSEV